MTRSTPTQQVVTADTTIAKLAGLWLSYLRAEGRIESTTTNEYERVLTGVVLPELGGLRLREATTSRIDLFPLRVRGRSVNRQRKALVVLGAMIDMAVRHDALPVNPVRQTSRVRRIKTETRSLTVEDLATVRAAVRAWTAKDRPGPRPTSDMAHTIDLMLATGARIGEVLALRWSDIELEAARPNLTINGTIKTEPGRGTYRRGALPPPEVSPSQSVRRRLPDPQRDLAAGQQRRAAVAPDPAGHRVGVGDPTHLPQDRHNPDLRTRKARRRPLSSWGTPPPRSPVSSTSPSPRSRQTSRTSCRELSDPSGNEDDANTWGISAE